jgi:hypothetical protein
MKRTKKETILKWVTIIMFFMISIHIVWQSWEKHHNVEIEKIRKQYEKDSISFEKLEEEFEKYINQ